MDAERTERILKRLTLVFTVQVKLMEKELELVMELEKDKTNIEILNQLKNIINEKNDLNVQIKLYEHCLLE
ncbi:hypothetical protein JOC77_003758 [Peribacillus deserti]|uniref:Uncharacterized protein n=1 Tax=Peribacillus deserti TaxID=673318 RepID=A0ABS2QM95_9BACI|nr:hypothetical protein [Peribacillus deserti]MBM7694297.1 hypothetical protein [Peribacillus deserti]